MGIFRLPIRKPLGQTFTRTVIPIQEVLLTEREAPTLPPTTPTEFFLLEDDVSFLLLEDDVSKLGLET